MDLLSYLSKVTDSDVADARDAARSLLANRYPDISGFGPGGQLEGLLLEPMALIYAAIETRLAELVAAGNLTTAESSLAPEADVDLLLSNYGVTREGATPAYGSLTIILSRSTTVSIPAGTPFTSGSQTYTNAVAYRLLPAESDAGTNAVALTARADGLFEAAVPVTSTGTGPDSVLQAGQEVETALAIPGLTRIEASDTFAGGSQGDSTASLVERAATGVTPALVGNAAQIAAKITDSYPETAVKVVGAQNPAMTRDADNLLGLSLGGKADVYVRTANTLSTGRLEVDAVLAPGNRAERRWSATFSYPGTVAVVGIDRQDGSVITPVTQILTPTAVDGRSPAFPGQTVAGSRYERRTVEWIDTRYADEISALGAGESLVKTQTLVLRVLPFVGEIDGLLLEAADPGLDIVTFPAVPAEVSVHLAISGSISDEPAARSAITAAILARKDNIPASIIYQALAPYVDGDIGLPRFTVVVTDRLGAPHVMYGRGEFSLPETIGGGAYRGNTMFMLDNQSITIEAY